MQSAKQSTQGEAAVAAWSEALQQTSTGRRWRVLSEQIAAGHEPCFSSDRRYTCGEPDCPWRDECRTLRATWRI
jgi:hypothetical protein